MNEEAKIILEKFVDEIRIASIRFELVLSLFGSDENLSIINKSAPNVFLISRNALMEATVIGLSRLCDPAKDSRGNKNLSIEHLRNSLQITDEDLKKKLRELEDAIKEEINKLNKYRSKRIAHNDLKSHLEKLHRSINKGAIDKSLRLLQEYTNTIYLHYENLSMSFLNPPYSLRDGPKRLLSLLHKAINE